MNGDQSLNQAAFLVKGLEHNLKRLLADIDPLLKAYADAHLAARAAGGGNIPSDVEDRIRAEHGYDYLVDNLYALEELAASALHDVDVHLQAEWTGERSRWTEEAAAG